MNIRALIAGVGTAAVVGTGGLVLTSTVASAQSKPQTLTYYTATVQSFANAVNRSTHIESVDNGSGKLLGFAVETVTEAINAPDITDGYVIYLQTGDIDATGAPSRAVPSHGGGKVTGGTGSYSKAAGTITTSADGTKTKVTIVLTKK